MTQPIDPTMWPKVESRHVSEDGIYWVNSSGRWLALGYAKGEGATPNPLYGPITFAKPVPAPEVTLYLVRTKDGDKWCQADAIDGRKDKIIYEVGTCRSRGSIEQANIIRTATLKEQA